MRDGPIRSYHVERVPDDQQLGTSCYDPRYHSMSVSYGSRGNVGYSVIDGSNVPANLGVNPALTITAIAEYIMSQIPEKSKNS